MGTSSYQSRRRATPLGQVGAGRWERLMLVEAELGFETRDLVVCLFERVELCVHALDRLARRLGELLLRGAERDDAGRERLERDHLLGEIDEHEAAMRLRRAGGHDEVAVERDRVQLDVACEQCDRRRIVMTP